MEIDSKPVGFEKKVTMIQGVPPEYGRPFPRTHAVRDDGRTAEDVAGELLDAQARALLKSGEAKTYLEALTKAKTLHRRAADLHMRAGVGGVRYG